MIWIKNIVRNSLLLFIGCILAFIVVEIILRVYNPFEFRVRGYKIDLPVNAQYTFCNKKIDKLDKNIIHRKNSLGFRGEEPPKDFKNHFTIITVGGSTTECFYLSEGKTWPDILGNKLKKIFEHLWINNAGLDGHSTFGHIVLMNDYLIKIKPRVILFLVGLNDQGKGEEGIGRKEKNLKKEGFNYYSITGFLKSLTYYSEASSLVLNIYRYVKAYWHGVYHREINLKEIEGIELPEETRIYIKQEQEKALKAYETRLKKLIQISRENGIIPVFMTQPVLYGNEIDDITNVNLARIKIGNVNGELAWEILELYNEVTRRVGKSKNVLVIDLARELPKSSRYFYDFAHYTNEGTEELAEIIFKNLYPFLVKKYGEYEDTDLILSVL